MATIKRKLSQVTGADKLNEVFLLVSISSKRISVKSRVRIPAHRLKLDGSITALKVFCPEKTLLDDARRRLEEIERELLAYIANNPGNVTKKALQAVIDGGAEQTDDDDADGGADEGQSPATGDAAELSFADAYAIFMHAHQTDPEENFLTEGTLKTYRVLKGVVERFQAYECARNYAGYTATLESLTGDRRADFMRFMYDERPAAKAYPQIFEKAPSDNAVYKKKTVPIRRATNTVVTLTKKLNAIINWCNDKEMTRCRCLKCEKERYAAPISLTKGERDAIASHDFGNRWSLTIQRDVFIFQCYIGCRISDLMRMTTDNVVMEDGDETIRYMPRKTAKDNADAVSIPLHPVALALVRKYDKWRANSETKRLFPFIAQQKYNDYLKDIFQASGMERKVTLIDPVTGLAENKPLWELATSHLARKTFISILGNAEVDQSVIKSMSGHKESNSNRAFARYFDITHATKRAAIAKLS